MFVELRDDIFPAKKLVSLSDFLGTSVNDLKSFLSGGIGKSLFLFVLNLSATWLLHSFILII